MKNKLHKIGKYVGMVTAILLLSPLVCGICPVHLGKSFVILLAPQQWGFGHDDLYMIINSQKVFVSSNFKCGYFEISTCGPNTTLGAPIY